MIDFIYFSKNNFAFASSHSQLYLMDTHLELFTTSYTTILCSISCNISYSTNWEAKWSAV